MADETTNETAKETPVSQTPPDEGSGVGSPAPAPPAESAPESAPPEPAAAAPEAGRRDRGGREGGREGGRGGRGGPGGRGPRRGGRMPDEPSDGLEDVVVKIYRCATVVKGGRRFSFSALVVVGDRNGRVGIGYGKANEVPNAVEKANKAARRNMIEVKLAGTTIPHRVVAKFGASKVLLLPAGEGTGVIAGASVRAVMELAGVKDVLTKAHGSTSPKNLVRAAFLGLQSLRSREDVAKLREVSIA